MTPSIPTATLCLLVLPVVMLYGFQPDFRYHRTIISNTRRRHNRSGVHTIIPSFLAAATNDGDNAESSSMTGTDTTSNSSHPWRIVMDIGREPLARMPFNWARQGVRMALVVPTDFGSQLLSNSNSETTIRRFVAPRSETVGFTGPEGAQESPIVGNEWSLSKDDTYFSASYTIANELRKKDIVIEAGTELVLSTRLYTQTELNRLNEEFYKTREAMWSTGGNLNDAKDRQQSSKKWNSTTERWEQRYPDDNPFAIVKSKVLYWMQNAKQEKARNERPEVESLSDRGGNLPGVGNDDEYVYLVQQGVVRYGGEDGPVCGLWKSQPITNVPARERGR